MKLKRVVKTKYFIKDIIIEKSKNVRIILFCTRHNINLKNDNAVNNNYSVLLALRLMLSLF